MVTAACGLAACSKSTPASPADAGAADVGSPLPDTGAASDTGCTGCNEAGSEAGSADEGGVAEGGTGCMVVAGAPSDVLGCECVMTTPDTMDGCCEEMNEWIAADHAQCGSTGCGGPCAAYCTCYANRCKGKPGCP